MEPRATIQKADDELAKEAVLRSIQKATGTEPEEEETTKSKKKGVLTERLKANKEAKGKGIIAQVKDKIDARVENEEDRIRRRPTHPGGVEKDARVV